MTVSIMTTSKKIKAQHAALHQQMLSVIMLNVVAPHRVASSHRITGIWLFVFYMHQYVIKKLFSSDKHQASMAAKDSHLIAQLPNLFSPIRTGTEYQPLVFVQYPVGCQDAKHHDIYYNNYQQSNKNMACSITSVVAIMLNVVATCPPTVFDYLCPKCFNMSLKNCFQVTNNGSQHYISRCCVSMLNVVAPPLRIRLFVFYKFECVVQKNVFRQRTKAFFYQFYGH